MIADPLKTLLLPFKNAQINWPDEACLFLNGCAHDALPENIMIQQYSKPLSDQKALPEISNKERFNMVLLLAGKQHQETQYLIGKALNCLKEDGILLCAAANDAGGKRLKKEFIELEVKPEELSKHKSRVVWGKTKGIKKPEWVKAGDMQSVLNGSFISQPGIFGWDKIDKGSMLLTKYLPDRFSGIGADFGCGYGYLADHVLTRNDKITEIYCMDADFRAVKACQINTERFDNVKINCLWTDLTKPQTGLKPLDWIIMNPPFHEGKNTQTSIGSKFIKTAASRLKAGGNLYMVANSHLPYERTLGGCFRSFETLTEDQGFKIFHARK